MMLWVGSLIVAYSSENRCKGEVFTTLQQLRERLQQVLEKITPEQICSLSSYNFILEALFYAASY